MSATEVRLFHRTTAESAARILAEGFKDSRGTYMTDRVWEGVWVSDIPLNANEGAGGDALLQLIIPCSVPLDDYEWRENGKSFREWLIPAALLNAQAAVQLVYEEADSYRGTRFTQPDQNP